MEKRRFRFLKKLSEGTFGKVYLAEIITESKFSKVVAIKLLHAKWAEHDEIIKRSRDEARVLGRLQHRNIIKVEGLLSIGGKCAIIMEYLNGVDLKSLINYCAKQQIRIPLRVVFDIISSVASALDAAYNKPPLQGGEPLRLIHRDIKPSNIMVTVESDVKVLDFGTAQAKFEDREAETQALAFGSAAYMSPERFLGAEDRLSGDVYALGVSLFELMYQGSYGKANVREAVFYEEQQRRFEKLPIQHLPQELQDRIVNLLSATLRWEEAERPSLSFIITETEELAQQINDGSLKTFCREVVEPCKELQNSRDASKDSLVNTILFEDGSDAFSSPREIGEIEAAPDISVALPPQIDVNIPPQSTPPVTNFNPTVEQKAPPSNPVETWMPDEEATRVDDRTSEPMNTTQNAAAHHAPANTAPTNSVQVQSSSKIPLIIGAVVLLALGGGAAWFLTQKPVPPVNNQPEIVESTLPSGKPGKEDSLGESKGVNIVLKIKSKNPVFATLRHGKYEYDWDGSDEMILKDVPTGLFKAKVQQEGKDTVRANIKVEEGHNCTYILDLSSNAEEWREEC